MSHNMDYFFIYVICAESALVGVDNASCECGDNWQFLDTLFWCFGGIGLVLFSLSVNNWHFVHIECCQSAG